MNYRPHHTAISVRNLDKSLEFYKKLGYEQVHRFDADDGSMSIVHLKLGDAILEMFAFKKNEGEPPLNYERANNIQDLGVKHIALQADNIEESLVELKDKGLASQETGITMGKTKIKYFFIQDPDGVWVEIVEDKRAQ